MGFSSVCRVTLSKYECPQSGEDGVPMAAIQESYLFCGKIVVRERGIRSKCPIMIVLKFIFLLSG